MSQLLISVSYPAFTGLPAILSTQLSACQLCITLTTLLTGYVAEPALGALLERPIEALGVPDAAAGAISLTQAMLIARRMNTGVPLAW